MEFLRFNMMQQYSPGNRYAGHYWAGGYRRDSREPSEFGDFVANPGEEPYVHLTPGNNHAWNTKSNENDRINGCLCKSQQTKVRKEKMFVLEGGRSLVKSVYMQPCK